LHGGIDQWESESVFKGVGVAVQLSGLQPTKELRLRSIPA
jgi:hypothetical protein